MPIYLSASSISDFLTCSKRYHYRVHEKLQSIASEDMLVGTIVHYAIERFWNNEEKALDEVNQQIKFYSLPATKRGKALTSIENFFKHFAGLLSYTDEIEYQFKLPIATDVFLVGKIDRISNENVFDWKTTNSPPSNISRDIQFLIYNEAYRRLFNKSPVALYYASLTTGKLIKFEHQQVLTNTLFNDIIPVMIDAIKNKQFVRKGLFSSDCHTCPYKEICFKELGYELDNKRTFK